MTNIFLVHTTIHIWLEIAKTNHMQSWLRHKTEISSFPSFPYDPKPLYIRILLKRKIKRMTRDIV